MRADAWRGMSVCYRRQQQILDLEHYLDCLVSQAGRSGGTETLPGRSVVVEFRPDLGSTDGAPRKTERDQADDRSAQAFTDAWTAEAAGAVESAVSSHCYDAAAVQHLLNAEDLRRTECEAIDIGVLERYARRK